MEESKSSALPLGDTPMPWEASFSGLSASLQPQFNSIMHMCTNTAPITIARSSGGEKSTMFKLPHPIPYQGSKRRLAPMIGRFIPQGVATFYEPFAGSAAMTIYAAHQHMAERFVIGDSLAPMVQLLRAIVEQPERTAGRYREIWAGQSPDDPGYFNEVRARYNSGRDPVDLLYLICRCVKNSVRFNASGGFSQSADKRRLGMQPGSMQAAIMAASAILRGRTEFRVGDWKETVADAASGDFVYLDPPYLGTSIGRDKRYHQQLGQEQLCEGLEALLARRVPFAVSYDGMTGGRDYGPPLPTHLGLTRLLLRAGKSSQATLSGRNEETVESLYLTPGLAESVDGSIAAAAAPLPLQGLNATEAGTKNHGLVP
jgi:DNA adenine methylase